MGASRLRPNKRLKLTGAPKEGGIPFVPQLSSGNPTLLRSACVRCARSLSAIRSADKAVSERRSA